MRFWPNLHKIILLLTLLGLLAPAAGASLIPARAESAPAPLAGVSAYQLIAAMNTLRVSNGLPALIEDPIIDAVAQSTAQTMAASQMSWHIGNVSGRLQAAGYGGGATVYATENFATGSLSIDEIMVIWSDASHMIPAVNPAYCHVGAGVASAGGGRSYYILQAAYTSSKSCGPYRSSGGGSTGGGSASGVIVPQIIVPVKIATPDKQGRVFHEVQAGQSLWAIAIAYKVTIRDLETWNNIVKEVGLKVGQKLFIPGSNTEGYSTPTPVGMVIVNEPGADGKIIHTVQPYQTLITIAQAYHVSVDTILALNGIQKDLPLQIGQKLVIGAGGKTAGGTQVAALSPLQLITPDGEGRYYHRVKSGETLSSIAGVYKVGLNELMAWNGLDGASIIYPDMKLLLRITPPATATPLPSRTPTPPAAAQAVEEAELSNTVTPAPEQAAAGAAASPFLTRQRLFFLIVGLMIATGLALIFISIRKQ